MRPRSTPLDRHADSSHEHADGHDGEGHADDKQHRASRHDDLRSSSQR
jgi:hypothetical protein